LEWLRPGDVLTYCLHPGTETGDESIVKDRTVVDAVWKAQERGILFDIGHGMKSFDFGVAEAAIAQGFMPDTISTDIQHRYAGYKPTHDMPSVISKLIASGMSEVEALERSTIRPAKALHMEGEIGSLEPTKYADVTLLKWDDENRVMDDCFGSSRSGGYFKPIMTIKGGEIVNP
jgi:dihydroorotase